MNRCLENFFACLIAASALAWQSVPADAQDAEGPYTFTIYVEEGDPTGHVFIGICNGIEQERWGWYTQGETTAQKAPGLLGCAGGILKSDNSHLFTVSASWPIERQGYYVVKSRVIARAAAGEFNTAAWSPFKHCGDFAEDAALAAGIKLDIPVTPTGYNRPGLFADYLRAQGGIVHAPGTSDFLAGKWSSEFGDVTLRSCPGTPVTGFWDEPGKGRGEITEGTFDPSTNQLQFSYSESWIGADGAAGFQAQGKASLQLSEDRATEAAVLQSLRGTWDETDKDEKPSHGEWTLTRTLRK